MNNHEIAAALVSIAKSLELPPYNQLSGEIKSLLSQVAQHAAIDTETFYERILRDYSPKNTTELQKVLFELLEHQKTPAAKLTRAALLLKGMK